MNWPKDIPHNFAHDSASGIAFHIGNFGVHTYALTMMCGMLFSILTVLYFFRKNGYSSDHLQILVMIIIPSAIIGARLWYVMGSLSKPGVTNNWYAFWDGGLAIQGGVSLSTFAASMYIWKFKHTLDWPKCVSIILPAVFIGQAIGRWGNYANGEVFGSVIGHPSNDYSMEAIRQNYAAKPLSWLGSINDGMFLVDAKYPCGAYRMPLFFIESMTSLIGYIVLNWVLNYKGWLRPGVTGGLYAVWYGIVRISMEPLRDSSDIMRWGNFQVSTFVSALYIVLGIVAVIGFELYGRKKYIKTTMIKSSPLSMYLLFSKSGRKKLKTITNKKEKLINYTWITWERKTPPKISKKEINKIQSGEISAFNKFKNKINSFFKSKK